MSSGLHGIGKNSVAPLAARNLAATVVGGQGLDCGVVLPTEQAHARLRDAAAKRGECARANVAGDGARDPGCKK